MTAREGNGTGTAGLSRTHDTAPGVIDRDGPAAASVCQPFPRVITRQTAPDNFEFPFATLNSVITPREQFFVRTHFEVPEIDANTWRLTIEGAVEREVEIGFGELRRMQSRTVTALLECSGNSRVFLTPAEIGVRWEQGAVSNAEWTGVPLRDVLDRAGLRQDAVEVVLEGSDRGQFQPPHPKTPGVISYARSLALEKARQPEVLLAWGMNGEALSQMHGYPVRAIVPGWYGMASVKWLKRIVVMDTPFHGYFQTFEYATWHRRAGLPHLVPVSTVQIKAQIARPTKNELVFADTHCQVFGAAWTGEGQVTKVEVSTDGGNRWAEAELLDESMRYTWRLWQHEWHTPARPGRYTIMARASDDRGRTQPMDRDDDRRDAVVNHVQRIVVEVR